MMIKILGAVTAVVGLGYWTGAEQVQGAPRHVQVSRRAVTQQPRQVSPATTTSAFSATQSALSPASRDAQASGSASSDRQASVSTRDVQALPIGGGLYTNHGFAVGHRPIVVPSEPSVERYVRYFTTNAKGRATLTVWLGRLARYRPMILATLRKHAMPEELIAVAVIESGLDPNAVSPVGATGMWQFIQETARLYGLRVTDQVDERRVPELATDAAVRHLRDLHNHFNSWPLALAAYNAGEMRISQVALQVGSQDFWRMRAADSTLPSETAAYVPKVMAMMRILRDLESFGFAPPSDQPSADFASVLLPNGTSISRLARALGLKSQRLRELNPALVSDTVFSLDGYASVSLPERYQGLGELVALDVAAPGPNELLQRIQRTADNRRLRGLLKRCSYCGGSSETGAEEDWDRLLTALQSKPRRTYRVKSGDSLHKVAKLLGVNEERLRRENGVVDPRTIQVGQILRIPGDTTTAL